MVFLLKILPKRFVSNITGFLSRVPFPKWILNPFLKLFVKLFQVNLDEALYPISYYKSLNEFFIRPIKPECRPVDSNPNTIVSPVDAKVSEFGLIEDFNAIQVKGLPYAVNRLITHADYGQRFRNGSFITLYLSPKDYHRIHTAYDGQLVGAEYSRGALFPVNHLGLHHIQNLFVINERLTSFFETDIGLIAQVKVAAINVGQIKTVYPLPWANNYKEKYSFGSIKNQTFQKGDELARFELGSTVILLFEKQRIEFLNSIQTNTSLKMGQAIAIATKNL